MIFFLPDSGKITLFSPVSGLLLGFEAAQGFSAVERCADSSFPADGERGSLDEVLLIWFIVLFCCKYVSKYQVGLDTVVDNLLTLLSSKLCVRVFLLILTL